MYGTVAHIKPKPGEIDQILSATAQWEQGNRPQVPGFIGEYIFHSERNPEEYLLVVLFEDKASYRANAESPDQDRFYRELRSHLQADPIWEDGEVIHAVHSGMST